MKRVILCIEAELYNDDFEFEKDGEKISGTTYGLQFCEDKGYKFGYKGKHKMKESDYLELLDKLSKNCEGIPILGADRYGNIIVKRIEKEPILKYDV